ncbi:DMT family transporter [Photobacterium leiognathi]|uniref:DMT family transporter n=1 Tax=Photobacterium leiognathi TaxID=553611 RepID=UPI002980F5C6|nr:SMR family transporter [Photobacterium leiognathi]
MKWVILILGILSNASASTLIKVAMVEKEKNNFFNPYEIITNLPLISGVILYGIAFVLYAIALSKLPLNIAHPILTSGSIAIVAIASVVFFGEKLSLINIGGIILIMLGVGALTIR